MKKIIIKALAITLCLWFCSIPLIHKDAKLLRYAPVNVIISSAEETINNGVLKRMSDEEYIMQESKFDETLKKVFSDWDLRLKIALEKDNQVTESNTNIESPKPTISGKTSNTSDKETTSVEIKEININEPTIVTTEIGSYEITILPIKTVSYEEYTRKENNDKKVVLVKAVIKNIDYQHKKHDNEAYILSTNFKVYDNNNVVVHRYSGASYKVSDFKSIAQAKIPIGLQDEVGHPYEVDASASSLNIMYKDLVDKNYSFKILNIPLDIF